MNIIREIKDEITAAYREPTSRDLTHLALLFLIIPGVIGSYLVFWSGSQSGYYWIGAGIIVSFCRLVPPLFRLIYRIWIALSVILGYFISRVLLTIIFVIVVVPMALIMRLVGKDPMDRRLGPDAPSYWIKREPQEDTSLERYERQF